MPAPRLSYSLSLTQQLCYWGMSWAGYYPEVHHVKWTGIHQGQICDETMLQSITTVLSQHSMLQSRIVHPPTRDIQIIPP